MLANTGLQKVRVRFDHVGVTNCGDLNDRHFCRCGANKLHERQMTSIQPGLSLLTKLAAVETASHKSASYNVNMTDRYVTRSDIICHRYINCRAAIV